MSIRLKLGYMAALMTGMGMLLFGFSLTSSTLEVSTEVPPDTATWEEAIRFFDELGARESREADQNLTTGFTIIIAGWALAFWGAKPIREAKAANRQAFPV